MCPLDKFGNEIPDNTPVAVPAGFRKQESLQDQMRRMIRTEMAMEAQAQGFESFEDADDFDVDDLDPSSPYEEHFDHRVNFESDVRAVKEKAKARKQDSSPSGATSKTKKKSAAKAADEDSDIVEDNIE